ncbi:MAG: response regulator [Patescibacteria group bacterium]
MAKKILFIEDEPTLQKSIEKALKERGYCLVSAIDGESGVLVAKKELPDLILLDLILPKKDGFEVLEELKADEKTAKIPVMILTKLEGSQDVERALALGATTYLVKANYELEDVVAKVDKILK